MRDGTRWRITGTFTTTTPMHVGSGEVTTNDDLLNEKNEEFCDVQAVVKDHGRKPCIPGTAVKGVLRAWAEQFYPKNAAIDRIFGKREAGAEDAESGRAEFHTATFRSLGSHPYPNTVPYWNPTFGTGIASSVGINRTTGAAERNKLFFHEFVPDGVTFTVEITLAKATAAEVAFLLAVLEHGAEHPTHPYQFGASGADGWGRVTWKRGEVTTWDGKTTGVGFACCTATPPPLPTPPQPISPPPHQSFALTLAFAGPFLVNDTSKTKETGVTDGRTNFTPLRRADGGVWLPASSFRGVLRSRAEFLLASRPDLAPAGAVERLFGHTGSASKLTVTEFTQHGPYQTGHQDFVAIDRFTGGAADGAKFDATYADRPTVRTTLVLDTKDLTPEAEALLAAALRDVCGGKVAFGFGGGKGYGAATGTLCEKGMGWLAVTLPAAPPADATPPPAPALTLHSDVLEVEGNKNPKAQPTRRLRSAKTTSVWNLLSKDLQADPTLGAVEVEYELADDQPVRVRRKGGTYTDPNPKPSPAPMPAAPAKLRADRFAHPYYFLRMADRKDFAGELGDTSPATHAKYEPDRYSGTLKVTLTTETPLLLLDTTPGAATEGPLGHFTYKVRRGHDGRPLLASSSVRGMLRATYEAITNSRFGVFPSDAGKVSGHARKLGLRPPAQSGLSTVPVRIERHEGTFRARLLPGTARIGPDGKPPKPEPLAAAWLAMYARDWTLPNARDLTHGAAGWAFVGPWEHQRSFRFWNVEAVHLGPDRPAGEPTAVRPNRQRAGQADWGTPQWVRGWVCVTGRNIDGKHDERFFFADGPERFADLAPTAAADYAQLVTDYQEVHREELRRGVTRPPALRPDCVFSRHITHGGRQVADSEREVTDGTLAYAALRPAGTGFVVEALYPVMISRKLYARSPRELVPPSLLPAPSDDHLSPADRVFGWVSQGKTADGHEPAHRGLVRVGPVGCDSDDAIETHPQPVPLAILGQPKPAQGRFYLGNADGFAQPVGGTKEERGYHGDVSKKTGNRVRGPKVYPHHQIAPKKEDARRPNPPAWAATPGPKQRSNQNRSVAEWVKAGTTFTFELHVLNLSAVELGALVWVLSQPAGRFLRLGLGKPLGFGSVRAVGVNGSVNTGAVWMAALPGEPPPADLEPLKAAFVEAVTAVNPKLLEAFEKSAAGFADLPIHYPPPQPLDYPRDNSTDDGGKHFQWFGVNEGRNRPRPPGLPLPDLTADPSLPVTPN